MALLLRSAFLLCVSLALAGCGVTAAKHDPDATDYILVSKGEIGVIWRMLVGGETMYCKVLKHGIPHKEFSVSVVLRGDDCYVELLNNAVPQ